MRIIKIGIFVIMVLCSLQIVQAEFDIHKEIIVIDDIGQIEILETVLNSEDMIQSIFKEGFIDDKLQNIVDDMVSIVSDKDFGEAIMPIRRKYPSDKNKRRIRMEKLITLSSSKDKPLPEDYSLIKRLHKSIEVRQNELYKIRNFFEFMENEFGKYENDTGVINDDMKKDFGEAKNFYLLGDYDNAKTEAIKIKVEMDLYGLEFLKEADGVIQKLKQDNFTTLYLQDKFDSAKEEMSVAYYKDIKKNNKIANDQIYLDFIYKIMKGIDKKPGDEYTSIDYISVEMISNEIGYISDQIYRINTSLVVVKDKLEEYGGLNVNVTESEKLYLLGLDSFNQERYDESESTLAKANSELELGLTKVAVTDVLAKEGMSYLKEHKMGISIFLILLIVFGPVVFRRIRLYRLTRNIKDKELENEVLIELIKKSQVERFRLGSIDNPTYHIKLDKYMEKISKIKSMLPVLKDIRKRFEKLTIVEKIYYGCKKILPHKKFKGKK
jgi:hypothetical protein